MSKLYYHVPASCGLQVEKTWNQTFIISFYICMKLGICKEYNTVNMLEINYILEGEKFPN